MTQSDIVDRLSYQAEVGLLWLPDDFEIVSYKECLAEITPLRAALDEATTTAASVRAEALREGYDLGFANSGEGYNGEYGADATGDYYIQRRAEAIIALIDPPEKSE